jgi:cytochrome c-type biogenesis protein CcmE
MSERNGSKRLWMGLGLAAIVGALALLVAGGLQENVVFFLTPSELEAKGAEVYDQPLRLGGQVKPGTVDWDAEASELEFVLRDDSSQVRVQSDGAPPSMFQEGIGVVVEGHYTREGVFRSDRVMVKHSNEYSPPKDGQHPEDAYETLMKKDGSS